MGAVSMSVKSTLTAAIRGRRRDAIARETVDSASGPMDASTVQIFAHGLIAELFGTGLRIQNLRARADDELHPELEQIADQIDKAIRELREFAFSQRSPGTSPNGSTPEN